MIPNPNPKNICFKTTPSVLYQGLAVHVLAVPVGSDGQCESGSTETAADQRMHRPQAVDRCYVWSEQFTLGGTTPDPVGFDLA